MMKRLSVVFPVLLLFVAGGCATVPTGPTVMVMPPPGKSFEQFQSEDGVCRQWAAQQIGVSPQETANKSVATGAVAGTAIGAGVGAAIGSAAGHMGTGAAIGAATGLVTGTATGASAGQAYGWQAQRQYDIAYMQCMYAKGNEVPGMGRHVRRAAPPPPPDLNAPEDSSGEPYRRY